MATKERKPKDEPETKEKVKQGHLNGLEPPSIQAVDDAAELYYDRIAASYKMRGKCDEAKTALLEVMESHSLTHYEFDDKEVDVTDSLTVKVKKKKKEAV